VNEIESIKFGIGTITSISHARLLQNSEISSEISARHELGAALPVWHPGGHCFCLVSAECRKFTEPSR